MYGMWSPQVQRRPLDYQPGTFYDHGLNTRDEVKSKEGKGAFTNHSLTLLLSDWLYNCFAMGFAPETNIILLILQYN